MLEPQKILHSRYRIEGLLGHGGMGAVYRAFDLLFDRPCALKEFSPKHLASIHPLWAEQAGQDSQDPNVVTLEKAVKLFKREAKLLATLDHPNLPKVSDYFSIDDDYFLVMTLVEGKDLKRMQEDCQGKPIPEQEVMGWMVQVMDALSFCHRQGIVHRDVKPANIILTVIGKVYLVDFGVAKLYDPGAITTGVTQVLTPRYSAPEQYTGASALMDARVDVYSLGATFYALLTGQNPLDAVSRLMKDSMPSPRAVVYNISPSLDSAIVKAMALDPEMRFQSIDEMLKAISTKDVVDVEIPRDAPQPVKSDATVLYPDRMPEKKKVQAATLQMWVETTAGKLSHTLTLPETRIGRASGSQQGGMDIDLSLLDQRRIISRHHASIIIQNGQFYLQDQKSHNGTWLNGQRITPETPYILHNGDKIHFGSRQPHGIQAIFTLVSPSP